MGNRKIKLVTINAPGRDQGKCFRIEEMDAYDGERWAGRAFHEIVKAGGEALGYTEGAGWAALAFGGFQYLGKMSYDVVQPLWDQLLTCVTRIENPAMPDVFRPLVKSDIDEVATIVQLKMEAFKIHANFSTAVADSTSTTAQTTTKEPSSSSTPTSPQPSGPSFHRARRPSPSSQRRSG